MEQNFNEHKHEHCHCKEKFFKYVLIFFATVLGAFLAFYFVADFTIKHMLSPEYQMRRAEKMMPNPVNITENNDSYVVTIALKPFGNSSKNIKVNVDNGNILKIEGSNEIKKGNKENMVNMMQSYQLDKNVQSDKMTTKEERGNYVVTLPFVAE